MCDKQCGACADASTIAGALCSKHDMIDFIHSPERAKFLKSLDSVQKLATTEPFSNKVSVTHISQYSQEKQEEWAQVKPYNKNADKGLATLASQRKTSPFKDISRG